jgi:hypothetical protein
MAEYISGYGTVLGIDILGTLTTYENLGVICTNFSEAMGVMLDTFHTLDSTISKTTKTGVDPEWSLTLKGDKTNAALLFLLGLKYKTGADAIAGIQITDVLGNVNITAKVTIGEISVTYETPTVIEVSVAMKPADGKVTIVA